MKSGSIKTTLTVLIFGSSALFGTSQINAQSRQKYENFPPRVNNQRQDD